MSVVGKIPNWTVTGKLDVLYPGERKKVTEDFNNSFVATGKSDAINQAKKFFKDMQNDSGKIQYSNLRNLKAEPSGW